MSRNAYMPRYATRRDINEAGIVDLLRQAGYQVVRLSGPGLPDLIVNRAGGSVFLEVKSRGGRKTARQVDTLATWKGAPLGVVYAPAEALAFCEARIGGKGDAMT